MKTFYKILIVVLFCITVKNSFAQVPQAIPYQGVARKNSGDTYNNQSISLRFSIHNSTANGTIVYSETQGTTTNSLGLFSVNIGEGNPSIGTFSGIDWAVEIKFLQVELDTLGGINFIDMGTQQMLSVPYALLSGKSADLPSGNSPDDVLIWDGSAWKVIPKCKLYNYYFRDADQDGFGDKYSPVFGCSPLQGFIVDSTDCDDNNSLVTTALTWYQDADGDNFGNISVTQLSCTQPVGYVANNTDCNDGNSGIHPNATDNPNDSFTDINCDGIDGTESTSIFVTSTGNDLNPGTKALPVKTIGAGITAASVAGFSTVLISSGVYPERIIMINGVSLHGAYNSASAWSRSAANIVTVTGQDQGDRVSALEGTGLSSTTTVDYIRFETINASGVTVSGSGKSNYAVLLNICAANVFRNCIFKAGNASVGNNGTPGSTGSNGNNGNNGATGHCNIETPVIGGSGGTSPCGRAGGKGGDGGIEQMNGGFGNSGVGSSNGGFGGNWGDPGQAGGNGGNGGSGIAGTNGPGGSGGSVSGGWIGTNGSVGVNGTHGNGGGGGGGGGGQYCTFCTDGTGNGGGGGGAGGCLGTGGGGGFAGGGSFGIFIISSTAVQIINSTLQSGNGGAGTSGTPGGNGGSGGSGGLGANVCTGEVGRGGNGGTGGNGGAGGIGGGGSGGPSYSVYRSASSATLVGCGFIVGIAGNGGTSPGGNNGSTGASGTIF